MSTTTQPLKYKFFALYKDGTQYNQPDDDRSIKHVEGAEWNPSSFSDVDQDKLEYFGIENLADNTSIAVHLDTGMFCVNGVWFEVHDQGDELGKLKLIYFREMHKDSIDGEWQNPTVNKYYIGWETVTGKKIKRTIGIS